jgi:RHS repeat-associated protein
MKTIQNILITFALLAAIPQALAQSIATNGTPALGTFSGGPDVINLANLNIHYDVPVFARTGIGLPFSYALSVDNGVWYTYYDGNQAHWGADFSTAQPVGAMAIGAIFYTEKTVECEKNQTNTTQYIITSYTGPDNTSHPVNAFEYGMTCPGQWTNSPTSVSWDNSGITVNMTGLTTATVTLRNGTVVTPPTIYSDTFAAGTWTMEDTNNNEIMVYAPNPPQISSITDTLGSSPLSPSGGPPPAQVSYSYLAPSGVQAPVKVTYESVTVQSDWNCPGIDEYPPTSQNLIDKIILPDTTFYEFFYEQLSNGNYTGRITSVTLPTGGTIGYTYTGGDTGKGIFCVDGSTSGFQRVSTESGTVLYSRTDTQNNGATILQSTTAVVDNAQNETVYDFSSDANTLYEVQRSVYQGSVSGTPLENVITCYGQIGQLTASACQSASLTGLSRVTVFRSLNGGPYSEDDTNYNAYGLVTTHDVYDWGATNYTQETQTSYATYLGGGIVDHPSMVEVVDHLGNLKSETAYSYDDFVISGDRKTCPTGYTKCRGNLTKLTKYATSSTYFTTQMTHNLNGTLATSTDPNGTVTTFTYSNGCGTGAFPTQTQVVFGSTTLTTAAGYNCNGAVLTSSTDANGKSTSVNYTTDPYFWRPNSSIDQASNSTTYTYTGQTATESAMNFNGNTSTVDVLTTLDAFGRPEYKQKRQGVNGAYYDSTQQVYDSDGRPYETSMPYQQTAGQPPTSGIYTQTSYDAMMRPKSVVDARGGIFNTSYNENDVYQQASPAPSGENTKQKQLEYDGLGRLTSVCEITSASPYSGTCGQVTGGYSGYLTKYTYDAPPNVNSLAVSENAQPNGGTAQSRSYYYDMLGRLTYESNPETGVTQYVYDSLTSDTNCGTISSPGDLVKKVDAIGNVACFTYDGLHRITGISYPNALPATPAKVFVYDSATVNGTTMALTAGRLAEAYTCATCTPTPTKLTDIGFSYSARGEITDVYESTPHSAGYNHVNASYWAHGPVATLSLVGSSIPTISYGGLDGEGRITTVTAGTSTTLTSGVTYTTSGTTEPIGSLTAMAYGSGDSDSFTYDTSTGRLTGYTFNMNGSVAKSGSLTWNPNGSLGQLAVTDNLNSANDQTCSYSADDLARIASASCSNSSTTLWGQTFAYDPFGNIDKTASAGVSFLPTYNLATNQYSTLPGCAVTYDNDGHLTNDCSYSYSWLADGTLDTATLDVNSGLPVTLTYDALGRVAEQARGATYTEVVYAPGGAKLALMTGATMKKAFVPLPDGGTAVYTTASGSNLAYYRRSDWLGSSRLASTSTAPTSAYTDVEYAPFGEAYDLVGNSDLNFTGQNQDTLGGASIGEYDFLFREYNPQQGRWISPDPAGMNAVSLGSPQTWNRYAYVVNSPLNAVDRLGLQMFRNGTSQDASLYNREMAHTDAALSEYEFLEVTTLDIVQAALQTDAWQNVSSGGVSPLIPNVDSDGNPILDANGMPTYTMFTSAGIQSQSSTSVSTTYTWQTTFYLNAPANNAIVSQQPKMVGPQPLKWWEKAGMVLACIAGMDPEFAAPISPGPPQPSDSTDSTNTTEGQGPPLGPNKGGGLVPYGGSPEVPSGAAGGAAYGAGVGQCITNVFTAWPK